VSGLPLTAADLAEFASRLTGELEDEYRELLLPFGLAEHASGLAAGRLLRSRLAAITAGKSRTLCCDVASHSKCCTPPR
jgi:hypothetical protein